MRLRAIILATAVLLTATLGQSARAQVQIPLNLSTPEIAFSNVVLTATFLGIGGGPSNDYANYRPTSISGQVTGQNAGTFHF